MNNNRLIELLTNFIDYCEELNSDDKEYFYRNVIGMTDTEISYFNINIEE